MEPTFAVVAGGAGFLGARLCARLLDEGRRQVLCVDDLSSGREENLAALLGRPGFSFLKASVCEPFLVPGRLERLYHLADPAGASLTALKTRGEGTLRLLERAARDRARVLVAPAATEPPSEAGGAPHAEALALSFAKERREDVRVARLAPVFGPGMRLDTVVGSFIESALKRRPIPLEGDGSPLSPLLYVEDAAEGLYRAMEADGLAGEVVYLGNPRRVTLRELARLVARACGTRVRLAFDPLGLEPAPEPRALGSGGAAPDEEAAHRRLGWAPRFTLEEALAATVEALRERVGPPEPRRRRRPEPPMPLTAEAVFRGLR
jgi:nucleoside-diphosphate-sugar epimerase